MTSLSAQNLTVMIGKKPIVHAASLHLEPGSFNAIIGPNGAGKTTLLKALAGLLPPSHGSVSLGGTSLQTASAIERAMAIGYLAQSAVPEWNLSAHTLVSLGRLPWQQSFKTQTADDESAIADALERLDLAELSDRLVDTLSGGELARVLLARVLAGKPAWILADEPLTHLDIAYQLEILKALRNEANNGTGVLVIIHDINLAARFADKIIIVNKGYVTHQAKPDDVLTSAILSETYGVQIDVLSELGRRFIAIST